MPFFLRQTPEQIKNYCRSQSLDTLTELNHRYGSFFEKIGCKEDANNTQIVEINQKIKALETKLEAEIKNVERAKINRSDVFANLPEDAAERYLVLQTLSYVKDDMMGEIKDKIEQHKKEKKRLENNNELIKSEFSSCIKELKIVNKVIDEKKLEASQLEVVGMEL